MGVKVSQIAFHHVTDTQHQGRMDAQHLTSLAYICITRAEDALKNLAGSYTEFQLFVFPVCSRRCGPRITTSGRCSTKREQSRLGRLPSFCAVGLESLYAICLMLEGPDYVNMYMRDGCGQTIRTISSFARGDERPAALS